MTTNLDQHRIPGKGGRHAQMFSNMGLKLYYMIFLVFFYADFGRFLPKTEDLEPFFRPYLGRKLG
jgi:hypothetical protein